ncbi:MAG: DUF4168 domain-containing protein [Pseudomonadota bacterium]
MRMIQTLPAVALSLLMLGVPVQAQEVPTDLPDIKAEDVTVGQVVSFVNAMIAAERVRQEYIAKIEQAETEDEIQALVAEADQRGMAEVERVRGISPAEYMAISLAARESEELTERITRRLEQMKQAQAPRVTEGRAKRPEDVEVTE